MTRRAHRHRRESAVPPTEETSSGWLDHLAILLATLTLVIMVLLVLIITAMVILGWTGGQG